MMNLGLIGGLIFVIAIIGGLFALLTWAFGVVSALALFFILTSVLMILVVLIQRPRGGGLSGAFGGAGGGSAQAAFGAKTGDMLTWVTVICFTAFLSLAVGLTWAVQSENDTGPDEIHATPADEIPLPAPDAAEPDTETSPDAAAPPTPDTPQEDLPHETPPDEASHDDHEPPTPETSP